ncbi:MAG: alpha amylase N-terminal ig-like domain-containing protein [Chloroflexi bacterium]|nr:alpha amylase N-terminal ig-like domain-containing protein [Chloroflexota bacterium]
MSARRWSTVVLGLLLALPGGVAAQSSSGGPAAAWEPLAVDGTIRDADLQHDSRSDLYRSPGGAVPAGSRVLLRLRAAAGDLESARLVVSDRLAGTTTSLPMAVVATDPSAGAHGHDWWQAALDVPAGPTILDYSFVVADGVSRRFLSDDPALDGGTGTISRTVIDTPGWQLTVYDPAFTTPDWTRGAVVLQVFPDRFANGDPTNDPSPDATPGPDDAARYRHGDVYGNPILVKGWDELPEGYCRAYQGVSCDEQPLGRDFYGGDLAGLTAHLDDLAARGVTAIYLNPIFAAPSNHRYDTTDYFSIDPDLGTDADFDAFIAGAHARGIKVILDGVFNHVSSDSPWFDRMGRYDTLGACESADSPYRDWFTFRAPGPGQPSPCAPSTPGGSDTYYESWAGFDTIPALREVPEVIDLIAGEDGVVRHWIRRGIDGWRLDVADDMSPELLRAIRTAARAEDPDALIIAEQWHDSSAWLLGDQADSTMDYRFRRAAIGLVNGDTPDLDGAIGGLTPSAFARTIAGVQEDYPAPAWDALLHMLDSHDTTRILWTLTPAAEHEAAKSDPAARAVGLEGLRLVSALQLTMPGMASVYYGDEVGLSGQDDPDDRRPYPWDAEDADVLAWYTRLGALRAERAALRDGDLVFLGAEDAVGAFAYLRRSTADAALVAVNVGDAAWTLDLDVTGRLPDGLTLVDALADVPGGSADETPAVVTEGRVRVSIPARTARVLLPEPGADLTAPPAPARITAVATPGAVTLSWAPVAGAASYQVWRSLVSGGGFTPVGETTDAGFVDDRVRNGALAVHVVTALDAVGNVSARSPEVVSLPQHAIVAVEHTGPVTRSAPVSLTGPSVPVAGSVTLDGATSTDAASGVRVEVGVGPIDSAPDTAAWTWSRAIPDGTPADAWTGGVRPEAAGTVATALRASADGGRTWVVSATDRTLEMLPDADPVAPAAPTGLTVLDVAADHVTLRWTADTSGDVVRYVVLRAAEGQAPTAIATTTAPLFTDLTVVAGTRYTYQVAAQDDGADTSPPSDAIHVVPEAQVITVTFRVTVPADTPADAQLYIAGDFQGWAPGNTPMTQVDASTWVIDLAFESGTALQYKYTRGSWEAVEKDAECGEIPNRTLTVDGSAGPSQTVEDLVGTWRDIAGCP